MPTNPPGSYTPRSSAPAESKALAVAGETAGQVLAAQAEALVKARYTIALRQPRDIDAVWQRLQRECERPAFAEVAIYFKPIGDGIEGPSIRLAEAIAQNLGNIMIDCPTVYDDFEKRIMRIIVADMESNLVHSKDVTIMKRVERSRIAEGQVALRSRTNSKGKTVYLVEATDDEILNTENALVSKALRTGILRLAPAWLVELCMQAVRATRAARDAKDPDAAKRQLFASFNAVGVSVEAVKEWLGHDGATLQPKELADLRGIYTAIKDGDTTWREVMDARWDETLDRGAKSADKAAQALDPGNDPPSMSTPTKGPAAVKAAIANGKASPTLRVDAVQAEALRNKIADRVGSGPAKQAWMDACRDCTGGRPSTEWTPEQFISISEYLEKWTSELSAAAPEKNGPKGKKDA